MQTVLQLTTSLFGEQGQSSRLATDFSQALAGRAAARSSSATWRKTRCRT